MALSPSTDGTRLRRALHDAARSAASVAGPRETVPTRQLLLALLAARHRVSLCASVARLDEVDLGAAARDRVALHRPPPLYRVVAQHP
jgi:hypothetical protein